MNTEYSHALLYFFIQRNRKRAESANCFGNLWLRLQGLCAVIKQYLTHSSSLITVIHGDAIRYGAGAFTMSSPSKGQVLVLLWQSKFDLGVLSPSCGSSFIECLKVERKFDEIESVRYSLTLHQILMVEYSEQQQRLLLKVTATPHANEYLQRQAIGLTSSPYIAVLNQMNMSVPNLITSQFSNNEQALLQTYVDGEVINVDANSKTSLRILTHCIELTLRVNKTCNTVNKSWSAYRDFKQLPQHFNIGQSLDGVVDYINGWLHSLSINSTPIHGDYHLGNIIFEPGQCRVRGMIDFDRSCEGGLPLHDALMLLLTDANKQYLFLGESISAVLNSENSDRRYDDLLNEISDLSGFSLSDIQHMAIVVWLFVLQSAMREGLQFNSNWRRKMVEQASEDAYRFCQQQDEVSKGRTCLMKS